MPDDALEYDQPGYNQEDTEDVVSSYVGTPPWLAGQQADEIRQLQRRIAHFQANIASISETNPEAYPGLAAEWQRRIAAMNQRIAELGGTGANAAGTAADTGPYDAFQTLHAQLLGRPASQDQLNSNEYLYTLSNELIRLLPAGRLETFDSARLIQLDNADLLTLILHNPHIANQIPGYRLSRGVQRPDGAWSGGLSVEQLQRIGNRAAEMGITGPGITELQATIGQVSGQPFKVGAPTQSATTPPRTPGSPPAAGGAPTPTLAREEFEARLANEPGNVYEWLFRSRGMQPVGGPRQISQAPTGGFGQPAQALDTATLRTQGLTATPGYGQPGNPWTNAASQIVNQPRPSFEQLRGQVQGVSADIPPGVLNPVLGMPLPSYTSQGGMPLLAPQTAARLSPAERAVWDVTVNRTGGRAEDDWYQAQRLGRLGGGAPTVQYTGVSRPPGT